MNLFLLSDVFLSLVGLTHFVDNDYLHLGCRFIWISPTFFPKTCVHSISLISFFFFFFFFERKRRIFKPGITERWNHRPDPQG